MTIINSQLGGKQPSGTITISSNTTTNVSDYEYAVTEVPTTAPAYYIEKTKDANGVAQNGSYLMDFSTFTDVGEYVFAYAYFHNTNISGTVNLSSLPKITGKSACANMFSNTNITSVDLSGLKIIQTSEYACQSMFNNCNLLTNVNLGSLTVIYGYGACSYMFSNCRGLISLDLGNLTTIAGGGQQCCQYMFTTCIGLTNIGLSSLKKVQANNACQYMFFGCTSLLEVKFPALKTVNNANVFAGLVNNVTGCTIHFPSNMSSYNFNCGGTNTTVLYDLPATNLLTGVNTTVYERNPKYDTSTALAWRVQDTGTLTEPIIDWTPFYTSGLTDPTVGTTIYSDSACTIAETTVDSIS